MIFLGFRKDSEVLIKKEKTNEIFQALLDHSNEIIIFLSSDFKILEFNKQAAQFYAWSREDVLARDFVALCARYQFNCPVDQGFFARSDHAFEFKSTVNSVYGGAQIVSWSIRSNFSKKEAGDVAIVLIGRNASFEADQERNSAVNSVGSAVSCLYWKDRKGRYLGCNEQMRKLTPLSSLDEVLNKTDHDLWPGQASQIVQNDAYVIKTGKTLYTEEVLRAADGRRLLFTSHKMPLRNAKGEIVGVIGNSVDITRLSSPKDHVSSNSAYFSAFGSSSGRVLLVETDSLTQKATASKLQKFHDLVDIVATGEQALQQLKKRSYQLVYMDLSLPDMPGYAVTNQIREWENEYHRDPVPIIALTEHVDPDSKADCLNAGISFVLQKPLTDELAEKMLVTFVIDRSFITTQLSVKREMSSDKIIDLNLGAKLAGGDGKMAGNMLRLLAAELPQNKKVMDKAYQEKDSGSLSEAIRQLHGSLCYCGAPRLKRAAEVLKIGLSAEPTSVDTFYRKLCTEIDVFLAAYQSSL